AGVISGNGNLSMAGGTSGTNVSAGAGTTVLKAQNTYTGDTYMNLAASGKVVMGVDNALPTTTNLKFGTASSSGPGNIEMNGHPLTVGSISSDQGNYATSGKISNTVAPDANLTISGSVSSAYAGIISDTVTSKINLIKGGSNFQTLNGAS